MSVEGLLSNILTSSLMNGICCVYSMQEQEARRREHEDFLRKTITVEMERQRIIERELLEKQMKEQGLSDTAVVAEARRRLLIATKIQAKRQSCSVGSVDARHDHSSRYVDDYKYSMTCQDRQRKSSSSLRSIVLPSSKNHRVTSAPVWCVRDAEYLSGGSAPVVSSLFDDEDDEGMEEIPVR